MDRLRAMRTFVAVADEKAVASNDGPKRQVELPSRSGNPVRTNYGGGSFSGTKASYIEGGLGRIEGITADRAFSNASAKGLFPLSFSVADIDQNGPVATANVTATAASGATATQPIQFVQGPSPTGWQVTKSSAMTLLTAAS